MIRWSVNLLGVLSLLIVLATVFISIRSFWVADLLTWTTTSPKPNAASHQERDLRSVNGQLAFEFSEELFDPEVTEDEAAWLRSFIDKQSTGVEYNSYESRADSGYDGTGTLANRIGFGEWISASNYGHGTVHHDHVMWVPWWCITLVSCSIAIPFSWYWGGVIRRQGRIRRGLCATCGYDQRATPERCPECGVASV